MLVRNGSHAFHMARRLLLLVSFLARLVLTTLMAAVSWRPFPCSDIIKFSFGMVGCWCFYRNLLVVTTDDQPEHSVKLILPASVVT